MSSGNKGGGLLLGGAAALVLAAGVIYQTTQLLDEEKKKRLVKLSKLTRKISHEEILRQLPGDMEEVQVLFNNDVQRLGGLKRSDIDNLVASLEKKAGARVTNPADESQLRRLVLGCSTQAVLALALTYLIEREREIAKDNLLLHETLCTSTLPEKSAISHVLEWRVASAKDPEHVVGRWKATLRIEFHQGENGLIAAGSLEAYRQRLR